MRTAYDFFFGSSRRQAGVPSHWDLTSQIPCTRGGTRLFDGSRIRSRFDNPDLIVACIIGDGESETCPLEGSWKSVNFF